MKLTLKEGQRLWFTSDTHFSHANICSATTQWMDTSNVRQFDSLEAMNDTLVTNLNKKVKSDDILFHLGDWSFGGFERIEEFRSRVKCKNIHLILGNHDEHIEKDKKGVQSLFTSVNKYVELSVKFPSFVLPVDLSLKAKFALMHFPIASWNDMARGVIHLHGHVHFPADRRLGPGKMMDVGVDGNGMFPIEMREVLAIMSEQPIKSLFEVDHHTIVENYK